MQWTFYRNREHIWHDHIKNVHREDEGETGEGGHLVVQLDAPDQGSFAKFPAELFPRECEKRAVLVGGSGKAAVTSMGELLARLMTGSGYPTSVSLMVTDTYTLGSNSKVKIREIVVRTTARHKVKFVPQEAAIYKDTTTLYLFSVVLRDGMQWALDPCNAQYCFTTPLQHECGFLPWDEYMINLGVSPGYVHSQPLLTYKLAAIDLIRAGFLPKGKLGRCSPDRLHVMAEIRAISVNEAILDYFPVKTRCTWVLFSNLPQDEYDRAVACFEDGYSGLLESLAEQRIQDADNA
jgi:hypothetical protein